MNATQAYEAAQTMIEQSGAELLLDELLRALSTDQLEEVLRFIATNWNYDVPELFEDEEGKSCMQFILLVNMTQTRTAT